MRKIIFFLLNTASLGLFAQNSLQQYTPSVLLGKDQMEFKLFNNLYTQTKIRDKNGNDVELGLRQLFVNNQFKFTYGVSQAARVNVGLEVNLTSAIYGNSGTPDSEYNKTLLSSVGPTIRLTPISDVGNFSIQSTFLFPVNGGQLENPRFVNHNRYTWFTQFYYDKSITQRFNIFFEVDFLYRIKASESQNNFFRIPASAIVSFFPTNRWTIYSNLQYAPSFGVLPNTTDVDFGRVSWYTQLGLGVKYLVLNNLELELSYGNFLWSKRDGAGQAFNLGVRFLK